MTVGTTGVIGGTQLEGWEVLGMKPVQFLDEQGKRIRQGNVEGVRLSLFPGSKDWTAARESAGMETNNHDDMHAGELETSILLHRFPEVVRDSYVDADHFAGDRTDLLVAGMAKYTTSGVIGEPSAATRRSKTSSSRRS